MRIAIAGGPGSGKTSLARQLTTQLYNVEKRNAQYVPEFARDYINACRDRQDGKYHASLADQWLIYFKQAERESTIPDNVEFVITDSPIFLPIVFALSLVDYQNYQHRQNFLHMYDDWMSYQKWYDLIIVLRREKPFLKDGTRGESAEEADNIGERIEAFLTLNHIPFHIVAGPDEQRLALARHLVYTPEAPPRKRPHHPDCKAVSVKNRKLASDIGCDCGRNP